MPNKEATQPIGTAAGNPRPVNAAATPPADRKPLIPPAEKASVVDNCFHTFIFFCNKPIMGNFVT